jgi:hypothetical protein
MNWININTATVRSPEFIGCDPTARATWLCLLAYCCEQENGGIISNCHEWGDRRWMQTCGVTRAEVEAAAPLVRLDGADVRVHAYPLDRQQEVVALRTMSKRAGKLSGSARREASKKAKTNGTVEPDGSQKLNRTVEPDGSEKTNGTVERNGKERKGIRKELEEKNTYVAVATDTAQKEKTYKTWNAEDLHLEIQKANTPEVMTPQQIEAFARYWSEPTPSGRLRLSTEKAWDTRRRMQTWASRDNGKPQPAMLFSVADEKKDYSL